MNEIIVLTVAMLIGIAWGADMQADATRRAAANTPEAKPTRKRVTASKLIALGVLAMDASCTYIVLYFCWLSIKLQFSGSLPYLTTLIGALQAATAVVLSGYFYKSGKENTKGGITYDAALGKNPTVSKSDTTDIFGTV